MTTALAPPPTRVEGLIENEIHLGDSVALIERVATESVHLILSDIPYGIGTDEWDVLHANTNSALLGASPAQRGAGTVFRRRGKPINGWSSADRAIPAQYQDWCAQWTPDWFRVLKPGGSALVFAGRRLGHRCVCAMEEAGFNLKDTLAWLRARAPHRAQRLSVIFGRRGDHDAAAQWEGWRVGNLRPNFEPILWFTKPYPIGTTIADNALRHGLGGFNERAWRRYVAGPENAIRCGASSNDAGLHPAQKPVRLMSALIELTTRPGQLVLDPFAGSGSTLVAAQLLDRRWLGFEASPKHADVCKARLQPGLLAR